VKVDVSERTVSTPEETAQARLDERRAKIAAERQEFALRAGQLEGATRNMNTLSAIARMREAMVGSPTRMEISVGSFSSNATLAKVEIGEEAVRAALYNEECYLLGELKSQGIVFGEWA
jgi:hypothetical protein